jgi:transposase
MDNSFVAVDGSKQLKVAQKTAILAWNGEGVSWRVIAERLGRDKMTINRFLARHKKQGKYGNLARKKRSGKPRKMTDHMLKILERLVKKYPAMTAADIKGTLPELSSLSDRMIQRHLQITLNLPSRSAAQKPLLMDRMKKKRLAFCRKYTNWTAADWGKVMYSDESTFRCIRSIKSRVRRAPGSNRFDSWYMVKTVKHPDSVMVWDCFTVDVGRGGLYILPKNATMNSERYQDVLENHLIPFMRIHGATNFLQDGAPCHASKRIKSFLKEQPFQVMDWPGNSPDLPSAWLLANVQVNITL